MMEELFRKESMMRRVTVVGLAVMMVAALLAGAGVGPARGQMVMPDQPEEKVAPEATQKEVRALLGDYLAALKAGDRKKALSLCVFKGAQQEKLARLSIEVDWALHALRQTVDKKLGEKAWGNCGDKIGEMTEASNKEAKIIEAGDDLVTVRWYADSKLDETQRLLQECPVRKTREGWRFDLFTPEQDPVEMRRTYRDLLGELQEITAAVEGGTIKSAEELAQRIDVFVKEMNGDTDEVPEVPREVPMGPGVPL
jgi:hypothetical protein